MELWSRTTTPAGIVSAMVGPATLAQLVPALIVGLGHVLLSEHAPLAGAGWTECVVPLTADDGFDPAPRRVTRLTYDALFETADFLRVADRVGRHGALVRQFARPPRADVDFNDARASVRFRRYQAFGLLVGIDLPHPHEVANLVALSEEALDQALHRLGVA